MQNEDVFTDFAYVDKNKYTVISFVTMVLFLIIALIFSKHLVIIYTISVVIYLIGSFCVLLLIKSTYELYKEKILNMLSVNYLCVAIYNFFELLPNKSVYNLLELNKLLTHSMVIFVSMYVLWQISLYASNKKINNAKMIILLILGILTISIGLKIINNNFINITLIIILISILFFKTWKNTKKFSILTERNLNFIILSTWITYFASLLYLISNLLNIDSYFLKILFIGVSYFVFITQCIVIVEKLLTNPYKVLFKDLFDKNNEMNSLNKKIVAKNRELEYSQMLIRKKEKMLRTFFSNVPIPLILLNRENERIVFCNNNFMELIGKNDLKKVINKKLKSIVNVENSPFSELETGNTFLRGTVNVDEDIKYFDMEFVDVSKYNDEIIAIFYDITSKVKIDIMRESIQNKIFEEGLKRDFLSNISHDLKTPINVIFSASQLMKFYIEEDNKIGLERYNLVSKQNCITLIRLTNNLIDSSRIYSDYLSANLEVRNIVEIIEEVITSLVDYAKTKKIDLIFDTEEEELFVELDEEFIQRIILNLLSNSMKFCNKNGQVEIFIKDLGDNVSVNVADNGVGMDKEFVENAFSRYSMGKNNDGAIERGTGIGLFVVKKLVEKQNGTIAVKSEKNKGTSFEMIFKKVALCKAE